METSFRNAYPKALIVGRISGISSPPGAALTRVPLLLVMVSEAISHVIIYERPQNPNSHTK